MFLKIWKIIIFVFIAYKKNEDLYRKLKNNKITLSDFPPSYYPKISGLEIKAF